MRVDLQQRFKNFVLKAVQVHGDIYTYEDVHYVNSSTLVSITCPTHGSFMQRPRTHVEGSGCPECALDARRLDWASIVIKSQVTHNSKYTYQQIGNSCRVVGWMIVACPNHGEFKQRIGLHLSGHGCLACSQEHRRLSKDEFIERSIITHGNVYDYSNTKYIDIHTKVIVGCIAHGDFCVDPALHIQRTGCPRCRSSKMHRLVRQYLTNYGVSYVEEHRFDDCRNVYPLPFDFYCPTIHILIECDGQQHYQPVNFCGDSNRAIERFELTKHHDSIKTEYCKCNNIPLLRIRFDEDVDMRLKEFLTTTLV